MPTNNRLVTADERLRMPEIKCRYELIRGEVIELPFHGWLHGQVAVDIMVELSRYVDDHQVGVVLAPCGF